MSRLLSEKRLITVDTSSDDAANYEAGAVVIDATNAAIKTSDGTAWTEIVLGSDVTIDTDLSSGATDTDVASALAAKTYTDDQISALSVPADRIVVSYEANGVSTAIGGNGLTEIAVITADTDIDPSAIEGARSIAEVYNYTTGTFRITALNGGIKDIQGKTTAGVIDILGGQKIVFAHDGSTKGVIDAYRSAI